MILTGSEIIKEHEKGNIIIEPFFQEQINPNSYNYRLGHKLKIFSQFKNGKSKFR